MPKSHVTAYSFLLAASLSFIATQALADNCELQITRAACPGKEELSYKKCDGKAACSEFVEAADAAACKTAATAACANTRLNITQSKVIHAMFGGAAITTDTGKADFCEEYPKKAEEFNHC